MKLILPCLLLESSLSPSVRGRGLKLWTVANLYEEGVVALRAGAWIETQLLHGFGGISKSPSVRGRGLKQRLRLALLRPS